MNETINASEEKVGKLMTFDYTQLASGKVKHDKNNWKAITFHTNQNFDLENVKLLSELVDSSEQVFQVTSIKECSYWKFDRHFHILRE